MAASNPGHSDSEPEPEDPEATLLERIRTAAQRAHDHKVAMQAEVERRDAAIVEAWDLNVKPPRIAAAAELSTTRCYRIVIARDVG